MNQNEIQITAQFINPATGNVITTTMTIDQDLTQSGEITIKYESPADGGPILRPTNPR